MNNPETPTPLSNEAFDNGTLTDENDALAFSRSLEIKLTLATSRIKVLEGKGEIMLRHLKNMTTLASAEMNTNSVSRMKMLDEADKYLNTLSQSTFPRTYSMEEIRPVVEALERIKRTHPNDESLRDSICNSALSTLRAPQDKEPS